MGKPVRELISGASWETAAGFESLTPRISIALPTFRRGDNGLLRQSIESLLAQTFTDFELIIVDDASVDSTRAIIEEFLARDSRIATIRHARNVGLPTVSCNEAIVRARATSLSFVFDDNVLEPDALQSLWDYRQQHPDAMMIHGIAKAPMTDGEPIYFGAGEFSLERLRIANIIPNGAVLIDREVFDTVGMYDPHISMIRIADWDLWLRVAPHFTIHQVDRVLVTEYGLTQSDSLGNSQLFDVALTREWFALPRDASLLPSTFLDYDVAATPGSLSDLSRAKIASLAQVKYPWTSAEPPAARRGYALVICDRFAAEVEACFMSLDAPLSEHLVTAGHEQLHHFWMYDLIYGASYVVLVGVNDLNLSIADQLRQLSVPYYWFVSNELLETDPPMQQRVGADLIAAADGLLTSGDDVADKVRALGLHANAKSVDPRTGANDATIADLLRRHTAPSLTEVMLRMNRAIGTARLAIGVIPAGYYTAGGFLAELSARLRRSPFRTFGSVARRLIRGTRGPQPDGE